MNTFSNHYNSSFLHMNSNVHANNYIHTFLLQLKNMIAALYASKSSGRANCFSIQGTKFGWKAIEDMLKREVERMKKNELVRVPGLRENFVYRDSWTRLNVKPAKIMQVFIHVHENIKEAQLTSCKQPLGLGI